MVSILSHAKYHIKLWVQTISEHFNYYLIYLIVNSYQNGNQVKNHHRSMIGYRKFWYNE